MSAPQTEMFDASSDPESINLGPSLCRAMRLSAERIERVVQEVQPTHIVATVSGGRDSAAEVELARDMGIKIDLILHCRTGTGIRQTTEHVVDHYGNLGPDFVMADAGTAYEEYVIRKGFFGIGRSAHNFSYRVLKATPMRKAISALAATRRENDRRIRCAHCPLMILPESMARHVEINHEEDDHGDA